MVILSYHMSICRYRLCKYTHKGNYSIICLLLKLVAKEVQKTHFPGKTFEVSFSNFRIPENNLMDVVGNAMCPDFLENQSALSSIKTY